MVAGGQTAVLPPTVRTPCLCCLLQNDWTYWCGVGVFHSGVEVYGIEYAFGGEGQQHGDGSCPQLRLWQKHLLGQRAPGRLCRC